MLRGLREGGLFLAKFTSLENLVLSGRCPWSMSERGEAAEMWAHSAPCCLHAAPRGATGWPAGGSPVGRATPTGRASISRPPSPARSPHCVVSGPGKGPPSFSSPCRTGWGPRGCLRSHYPSPRLSLSAGCHRSRGHQGRSGGMFHVSHSVPSPAACPSPARGRTSPGLTEAWVLGQPRRTACRRKGFLKNKEMPDWRPPWHAHQLLSCRTGQDSGGFAERPWSVENAAHKAGSSWG